jgi:diadenosine tetraphosphate (Ap4A) HIT family hydrolase
MAVLNACWFDQYGLLILAMLNSCELCREDGGELLHRATVFRVLLVNDPHYPGFCRVVWNGHVREMTDLSELDRTGLMRMVWQVEAAVREIMRPDKINVASLGNLVPHLHWHVIPRYVDDVHFPGPVWAQPQRDPVAAHLAARKDLLPQLRAAIVRRIGLCA